MQKSDSRLYLSPFILSPRSIQHKNHFSFSISDSAADNPRNSAPSDAKRRKTRDLAGVSTWWIFAVVRWCCGDKQTIWPLSRRGLELSNPMTAGAYWWRWCCWWILTVSSLEPPPFSSLSRIHERLLLLCNPLSLVCFVPFCYSVIECLSDAVAMVLLEILAEKS